MAFNIYANINVFALKLLKTIKTIFFQANMVENA